MNERISRYGGTPHRPVPYLVQGWCVGKIVLRETLILIACFFVSSGAHISAFIIFTRYASFFAQHQNLEYILATLFIIIMWNYPLVIAMRIARFFFRKLRGYVKRSTPPN